MISVNVLNIVHTKEDRKCECCEKVIKKGTECLSRHKRFGRRIHGRVWYCFSCVMDELGLGTEEEAKEVIEKAIDFFELRG